MAKYRVVPQYIDTWDGVCWRVQKKSWLGFWRNIPGFYWRSRDMAIHQMNLMMTPPYYPKEK